MTRHRICCKQWIFLLLVIFWTAFIWGNSLHTGEESKEQSSGVEECVLPFLDILGIPADSRSFFVRKAAHLTEFMVLGFLWSGFFQGRRLYWPFVFSLLTGAADEILQLFVPGRSGQLTDVLIDASGASVGVAVAGLVWVLFRKIRKNTRRII